MPTSAPGRARRGGLARTLLRRPVASAVAVLCLGAGTGQLIAIFLFLKAIFLNPLPVAELDRLAALFTTKEGGDSLLFTSRPNYLDYRAENRAFSDLLAYAHLLVGITGEGEPEQVHAEIVSGNYFDVLGVRPAMGRGFLAEEDATPGTHAVVVLSDSLWRRRYGADPALVGRPILANGQPLTVVGIAPPGFRGLNSLLPVELWFPTMMHERILAGTFRHWFESRRAGTFELVGRLLPGMGLREAEAALRARAGELAAQHPAENGGKSVALVPLARATIPPNLRREFARGGLSVAALSGSMWLLALAAVSSLLLLQVAVGPARSGGLGAGPRSVLLQGLVLALAGGAVGLAVAPWVRAYLWRLRPPRLPEAMEIGLDLPALGFALALSLSGGVLCALLPARRARARSGAGAGRGSAATVLVVAQAAVALLVLVGASFARSSLRHAEGLDPGVEASRHLVLSFDLGALGYDEGAGLRFYRELVQRVEALPEVESAAIAESLNLYPMGGYLERTVLLDPPAAGAPARQALIQTNTVGLGYLETVGIPLASGRTFTEEDRSGSPWVVVVNSTLAAELWPGEEAVGKSFTFSGDDAPTAVIGVAADAKYLSLGEAPKPYLYIPLLQLYTSPVFLHARTRGEPPDPVLPAVRRELQALDPRLAPGTAWPFAEVIHRALWAPRLGAGLMGLLAPLALALAAVGTYGSIGSRALGPSSSLARGEAGGGRLGPSLRLLGRELPWIGLGVALGLATALAARRFAADLLFSGADGGFAGLAAPSLALVAAALFAGFFSVRRAASGKPAGEVIGV